MKDADAGLGTQAGQVFGAAGELHALLAAERPEQISRADALGQLQQQLSEIGLVDAGVHQGRMRLESGFGAALRQRCHAGIDAVMGGGQVQQHDRQRGAFGILMLHGQYGVAGAAHPVGDLGQLARQQRQQLLRMGHQPLRDIDQTQPVRLQ
jgi:hypothetical protein